MSRLSNGLSRNPRHATHEDERAPEGGLRASGAFQHQVDDGHLFPCAARYASFRSSWP
jgi:hypothetical protein